MTIDELENGNYKLHGNDAELTLEELYKLETLSTDKVLVLFTLPKGESKYRPNPSGTRDKITIDFSLAL
jgi:hypothetical protein